VLDDLSRSGTGSKPILLYGASQVCLPTLGIENWITPELLELEETDVKIIDEPSLGFRLQPIVCEGNVCRLFGVNSKHENHWKIPKFSVEFIQAANLIQYETGCSRSAPG